MNHNGTDRWYYVGTNPVVVFRCGWKKTLKFFLSPNGQTRWDINIYRDDVRYHRVYASLCFTIGLYIIIVFFFFADILARVFFFFALWNEFNIICLRYLICVGNRYIWVIWWRGGRSHLSKILKRTLAQWVTPTPNCPNKDAGHQIFYGLV